jgi:DNA-binding CsgD family transcriptional regulator
VLLPTGDAPSDRIIGLLLTVFVAEAFVEECLSSQVPFVANRLVQWLDEGKAPFASPDQMARANGGDGNDLLIVEWAVDLELSLVNFNRVKRRILDEYVLRHSGWKVRRLIAEACYRDQQIGLQRVGFGALNSYSQWKVPVASMTHPLRPILMGMERRDTRAITDTTILRLFDWSPPKCGFTFDQMEVLELLCEGLDDIQIKHRLTLSSEALRKRWSRIYEKIEHAYPGALNKPAMELRRLAREFVVDHLYEIRPSGAKSGRPQRR